MQLQEEQFYIVIASGGLLALQTAIQIIDRQTTWNLLLLEENSFLNSTCLNQFEPSSINTTGKKYLQFGPNIVHHFMVI
jgi:hypothetical protein